MESLIGKKAPPFTAQAVVNGEIRDNFSLESYRGKYLFFFFYPLDFTFVCPTEIITFGKMEKAFAEKNCAIVGCSIDTAQSHIDWLNTPLEKGGIKGVEYPLIADTDRSIAKAYGTLSEEKKIAFRGLYLIDKEGFIRHQVINDFPLGRSTDEAMRMLDALQFYEKNGEVCPMNWHLGDEAIKETKESVSDYLKRKG
ncbi:MAG: Alkyl hydroperoxide reductase C [Chlamydiia bacterium]|nr:Alkyl hydroperoxide reductase C [Chlamydiia bacterium]